MTDANLQERFAWRDVVEDGKCTGWGWVQTCTVQEGRVRIECIKQPVLMPDLGMKLNIVAVNDVTQIDYIDTGLVLREYVAMILFDVVIQRLRQVQVKPVHLVAPELLKSLAKDGLLAQLFGNQRSRRGQVTH